MLVVGLVGFVGVVDVALVGVVDVGFVGVVDVVGAGLVDVVGPVVVDAAEVGPDVVVVVVGAGAGAGTADVVVVVGVDGLPVDGFVVVDVDVDVAVVVSPPWGAFFWLLLSASLIPPKIEAIITATPTTVPKTVNRTGFNQRCMFPQNAPVWRSRCSSLSQFTLKSS